MNEKYLKERVDKIISISSDYEAAHCEEDNLHLKIIKAFCPDYVIREINRLCNADFPRYCA